MFSNNYNLSTYPFPISIVNNNKIIIKRKESNNENKIGNNKILSNNDKTGKIEELFEKYYNSQGNRLGEKIIIKKKYKNKGEKIIEF